MAVTPVDVGGSLARGLQVNQLRQQLEAQKAQQQERNAMKSLYAERFGGTDPKSGITWNTGRQAPAAQGGGPAMTDQQFVGRAMSISPEAGMDWQKHFASQDAAKLERDKAEAPLFAAALEGVQDQQGYDRARQFLTQRGIDVSDMPPQYDPQTTNMVVQGSKYLAGITDPKGVGPTNIAKLIAERDALPPDDPRRQVYNDAITKASTNAPPAQTTITNNMGPSGIDYGKPEPGLAWARNPDGSVKLDERGAPIGIPYQGGSVYREGQESEAERQAAEEAAAQGQRQKATTANIVVDDIDRVFDIMETSTLPVAGFGSWASAIPGTPPHDVARLVDTVRANVGFDKLQAMREASPTGGALGQVSENENRLLQSTLGNLEQSQSPEQFRRNLERVREIFLDIVHGAGARPAQGGAGEGAGTDFSTMAPEDLMAVDESKLSDEELDAYIKALSGVGN